MGVILTPAHDSGGGFFRPKTENHELKNWWLGCLYGRVADRNQTETGVFSSVRQQKRAFLRGIERYEAEKRAAGTLCRRAVNRDPTETSILSDARSARITRKGRFCAELNAMRLKNGRPGRFVDVQSTETQQKRAFYPTRGQRASPENERFRPGRQRDGAAPRAL